MLKNDEEDTIEEENIKKAEIKMLGYKKQATFYLGNEVQKHYKEAKLTAAAYHQDTRILVIGFNIGSFYLYEMPHANLIHSLRYSKILVVQENIIIYNIYTFIILSCH